MQLNSSLVSILVAMDRETARFCCDSEIMGYHVYQDVWEAEHGGIFCCFRETGNAFDPFAVCVKKDAEVVGHVHRKISAICSIFCEKMVKFTVKLSDEEGTHEVFLKVD